MKTNKLSHRALLSYICLPVLLVVSISSSAAVQVASASSMQAIAVMNQQEADGAQEEATEEASKPTEVKDQAAEDEKRKKYCATARKNLELLRSNTEGRAFTTEDGSIVKYTPDQLQKMIKESEAAEKANCD
jgi:hypothetical protein